MDDFFDFLFNISLPLIALVLLFFITSGELETLIYSFLSEKSVVSVAEEVSVDDFITYDFKE